MEYTVFDLIRILLKRWYIILLSMIVVGGLSVFTSKLSFQKVQQDYSEYTATVVVENQGGTLESYYLCDYRISDFAQYNREIARKYDFHTGMLHSLDETAKEDRAYLDELTEQAYALADSNFLSIFQNGYVLGEVQKAADETLSVSVANCLTVEVLNHELVKLSITALDEDTANELLSIYWNTIQTIGKTLYAMDISCQNTSYSFVKPTQQDSFAQMIMAEPTQPPNMIKTVGTAAVFSFVMSCFVILLVTFIKDSKATAKKE